MCTQICVHAVAHVCGYAHAHVCDRATAKGKPAFPRACAGIVDAITARLGVVPQTKEARLSGVLTCCIRIALLSRISRRRRLA